MTYKQKLMKEKPDAVSDRYCGGCSHCPHTHFGFGPKCEGSSEETCTKCWNTEIPGDIKPAMEIDLHKIIDDAMEKKDREVTIFISKDHTHITVSPYKDSKPRWIPHQINRCRCEFECSECGARESHMSSYCPHCGEKLAAPIFENKEVNEE